MAKCATPEECPIVETYKQRVEETFAMVKLLQFAKRPDENTYVSIEKIYVELQCENYHFSKQNAQSGTVNKSFSSNELVCKMKTEPYRRNNVNMVILGLPGSGKSTLLKHLLHKYNQTKNVIPIYVGLKEDLEFKANILNNHSELNLDCIKKYIRSYFQHLIPEASVQDIDSVFSQELEYIFFCDGLDEISREEYDKFTVAINAICCFRGYRAIISSREIGFYEKDFQQFHLYSLMDFDSEKQKIYVNQYYKVVYEGKPESDYKEQKDVLLNLLDNNETIKKLAKSPILLSLMCVTKDIEKIKNKAQLFDSAIRILLENREIKDEELQNCFIRFLKEIAVIFFKLDQAECFDQKDLEFYAKKFFCNENDETCRLLRSKYKECGLFDKNAKSNTFKFTHRTIWEYLVAAGMVNKDKNEIYSRSNMAVWEEPIKMYVTLIQTNDIKEVLEGIWRNNKALALRCMTELETFPEDIFNNLYGQLSKLDKLRLIATLRESYTNPSSEYRKQIVNVIRDTLTLIHSAENKAKDCEVIYSYIDFLEEFQGQEAVFKELLSTFLDLENAKSRREKLINECGLSFHKIYAGTFTMGRDPVPTAGFSEEQLNNMIFIDSEEMPAHQIIITHDYYISQTLVTNKMYYDSGFPYADHDRRTNNNPYSNEDNQPVNKINWYEAIIFAKWLGCTLPTEAEWEYACVGIKEDKDKFITTDKNKMINALNKVACYSANSQNKTRPVLPVDDERTNSWGLQDMLGNLREWCLDWYDDSFYTLCTFDSTRFPNFEKDIEGKEFVSYSANGKLISPDQVYHGDLFTFNRDKICCDPLKLEPGKFDAKCLRGGCFDWNATNLRPTYRNHNPANNVYKVNGFRLLNMEGV